MKTAIFALVIILCNLFHNELYMQGIIPKNATYNEIKKTIRIQKKFEMSEFNKHNEYSNTSLNSIADDKITKTLTFLPNPANDNVSCYFRSEIKGSYEIIIRDVYGNQIMRKVISMDVGINEIPLELSGLLSGYYNICLKSDVFQINEPLIKY